MSDFDDLRTTMRSVDGELDHARVLRTVHASRRPAWWTPLAAAAAVACVLLASVGVLAWVTALDEPGPAQPATAPPATPAPDPAGLAVQVKQAIAAGGVACSRVLQGDQVVYEQLRRARSARAFLVVTRDGVDAGREAWPGCGPADEPTTAPTTPSSLAVKALIGRDLFAPLRDQRYDATAASATSLTLQRTTGPAPARLRYDYRLDPATLLPISVRVSAPDGTAGAGTVAWFPTGSEQDRFVRAYGQPVS